MREAERALLVTMRRARDLIDQRFAEPLTVAEIAASAHLSPAHFARTFTATYGESPYAYLMSRRIERAKALLRGGELSVTEVCLEVGCRSLGSFSARFAQVVGETPSAYRAREHGALAATSGCLARQIARDPRQVSRNGEARGADRT